MGVYIMIYIFLAGIIAVACGVWLDRKRLNEQRSHFAHQTDQLPEPPPVEILPHQGMITPVEDVQQVLDQLDWSKNLIEKKHEYYTRTVDPRIQKITSGPVGQPREYRKP